MFSLFGKQTIHGYLYPHIYTNSLLETSYIQEVWEGIHILAVLKWQK